MNNVEVITCKKCSSNIGMLTVEGDIEVIPNNPTSKVVQKKVRPSDVWFRGNEKSSVNITALCTTCMNADSIITLYLENHSTGHTQTTLLQLIVIAQLLITDAGEVRRNILDITTLKTGGIVFDYSMHVRRKKKDNKVVST